jgi:hypothetical protein
MVTPVPTTPLAGEKLDMVGPDASTGWIADAQTAKTALAARNQRVIISSLLPGIFGCRSERWAVPGSRDANRPEYPFERDLGMPSHRFDRFTGWSREEEEHDIVVPYE